MKRLSCAGWMGLTLFAILGFCGPAHAQCPTQKRAEEIIAKFQAPDKHVLGVKPTAYSGLCEVQVLLNGKTQIFYTGPGGDFLIMGQLYDSTSGRNVTRESLEAITLFSPEEMSRLAELSALTIGQQGQDLFYVTDPQCPYCKQGVETLQKMSAEGVIRVHFLFFPLEFHKGAREQSIATICDKKSIQEFENGYRSENLCAEGIRKIDATRDLLAQKGITGTPAYIFPDRRFHVGLLDEAELRRRLGLTAAAVQKAP